MLAGDVVSHVVAAAQTSLAPTMMTLARQPTMTIDIVECASLFRDGLTAVTEPSPKARLIANALQHGYLNLIEQHHPDVMVSASRSIGAIPK